MLSTLKALFLRPSLTEAKRFVATDEVSGAIQFDILRQEGLQPHHSLLEIGCGCLNVGVHLIDYLKPWHYVGVDPNEWLRRAAIKERGLKYLIKQKSPIFLSNAEFDASSIGRKFDFSFSHSVLSHAAHGQLDQYLRNVSKVLAPRGRILASIRLAEGNEFGSSGSDDKRDSLDKEWVYPDVSWFTLETIKSTAAKFGLSAIHRPEYTKFYIERRPKEFHDWIVFNANP